MNKLQIIKFKKYYIICQLLRESKKNLLTLEKIHPQTAQLDLLTKRIHIIGRQQLWGLMILHTQVESFSLTSISLQITHSSLLRLTSRRESIIQILTQMVLFAWIFSRNSGHQLSLSQRYFFQLVPFWLMLIQMIHWFLKLLKFTRMIERNLKPLQENGLESMLCEDLKSYKKCLKFVMLSDFKYLYKILSIFIYSFQFVRKFHIPKTSTISYFQ